jgi:hypothetical protein
MSWDQKPYNDKKVRRDQGAFSSFGLVFRIACKSAIALMTCSRFSQCFAGGGIAIVLAYYGK